MKHAMRFLAALLFMGTVVSCNDDDDSPTPNPNTTFIATMNGTNEVPPVTTTASGAATATFNTSTKVLSVTVNHSVAAPTVGHIHLGAAGVAGPPVFTFSTVTSPFTYTTGPLTAQQESDLNANLYYVNIHTAANVNGEIRGQLIKQ